MGLLFLLRVDLGGTVYGGETKWVLALSLWGVFQFVGDQFVAFRI